MCIIAVQYPGSKITKEIFNYCAKTNPDGFGLTYINNKKVVVKKTMSKESFWDNYLEVHNLQGDKTPIIMHFRIGTAGIKDERNCHPFFIKKDEVSFVHNGVIGNIGTSKEKSDTQLFNDTILKNLSPDFLDDPVTLEFIEDFIGSDKLAFLDYKDNSPRVTLVNEMKGTINDGIWYSHSRFEPYKSSYNGGYSSKSRGIKKCSVCSKILFVNSEKADGMCYLCKHGPHGGSGKSITVACGNCGVAVDKELAVPITFHNVTRFMCQKCVGETIKMFKNVNPPLKKGDKLKYLGKETTTRRKAPQYTITRVDNDVIFIKGEYIVLPVKKSELNLFKKVE